MQPGGLFGDLVSIIQKPKDKGILLKDVLENEVGDKYFLSEKAINKCLKSTANENMLTTDNKDKSGCLIAGYYKTPFDGTYVRDKQFTGLNLNAKSRTIRNGGSATATDKHNWDLIVHNMVPDSGNPTKGGTGHLSRTDGKTYCLDTGNTNAVQISDWNFSQTIPTNSDKSKKHRALLSQCGGKTKGIGIYNNNNSRIRRLTPLECERLQTVKDNYTNHVSDSQRYKMLGNGWTVDVIAHIFKNIKI
jgi:site-specific DNA-cytosine methylase